jgi:hypothetical protein
MSIATLKRKTRNTSPRYPISDKRFSIIGGYRNRGGVGRFPMIGSDNYVSFNDSSYIKNAVVSSSSKAVLRPCGSGSNYDNIYLQEAIFEKQKEVDTLLQQLSYLHSMMGPNPFDPSLTSQVAYAKQQYAQAKSELEALQAKQSEGHCCCTGYPKEVVKSYIIAGDRGDPNTSKGFSANNTDASTYITAKKLLNNNTICRTSTYSSNNDGASCCQKDTAKTTQNTPMSSSEYLSSSYTPIPLCGGKLLPFPIWINNNGNTNIA